MNVTGNPRIPQFLKKKGMEMCQLFFYDLDFFGFWTEFNKTGISFRPGPNPNKEMEKRYLLALLLQPF